MEKDKIEFSEFLEIEKKLEIKIGKVASAERVEKSKKLLKLTVFFSDEDERTVLTNIGSKFHPDELIGLKLPFITNLYPVIIMGITSEAMIMVGNLDGAIELNDYSIGANLL